MASSAIARRPVAAPRRPDCGLKTLCTGILVTLSVLAVTAGPTSASLEEGRELIRDLSTFLTRKILPIAQEIFLEVDVSSECSGSLFKLLSALRRNELWALKMLTASGLVPTGVMYMSMTSLGSYGQCLSTRVRDENAENGTSVDLFTGRYCGLHVIPNQEMYNNLLRIMEELGDIDPKSAPPLRYERESFYRPGLRLGLCVPSICSEQEMNNIVSKVAARYELYADISSCHTTEEDELKDPVYYVAIFVPSLLIFVMTVSTLLDINGFNSLSLVKVFSAMRNSAQLVAVPQNNLTFLHGLKAILAYWIVLGHCYLLVDPHAIFTVKEALDVPKTLFFQIAATGAFLGVTVFFVSTGFIVTYSYLCKNDPTPPVRYYFISIFRRYYRLIVPAFVVMVAALALPYIVQGPLTDAHFRLFTNCKDSWYKVPLEIVNADELHHMCLSHYWYISVDYQIILVLFPVIILYKNYPRGMTALIVALFFASGIVIAATTYLLRLVPFMGYQADQNELIRVSKYVYFLPSTHIGSVALGILTGYLVHKRRDMRIPPYLNRFVWVLTLGTSLVINLLPVIWYRQYDIPRWGDALYGGFHRHVYAISAAWLIFACSTGNAKTLSTLLSSAPLVILGKLSYGVYLVHYPMLIYFLGVNATGQQLLHSRMVRDSLGIYCLSLGVAYVVHLCIEAPVIAGDAMFFRRPRHTKNGTATVAASPAGVGSNKMTVIESAADEANHQHTTAIMEKALNSADSKDSNGLKSIVLGPVSLRNIYKL